MARLTAAIILFYLMVLNGFSQNRALPLTLSLQVKDLTLEEVLQVLEHNYGIHFYYSSTRIPLQKSVSIAVTDRPLNEILDLVCSQSGTNYRIKGNQIILVSEDIVYTVSGYVKDTLTGEYLIGAAISFPNLAKGVFTNGFGFYSYSLPPGKYLVKCSSVGYKTVEKQVEINNHQSLTFFLKEEIITIPPVKLEYSPGLNSFSSKPGTDLLPVALFKSYPALFGENDVIQFIKMMPGVQTNTEGLNGLYVRGSLPQHTSFEIDDAPMFNMFHVSGWFSTINPDAVADVKLYKSHLPLRAGSNLGSVVDIRLRDGNNQQYVINGGIGTITSRLTIEGPIIRNKSSFILSARRSYLDQLARLFKISDSEGMSQIYFYDINAKLNYTFNNKNRLFISSYTGHDLILDEGGVKWGNSLLSGRWNHLFSDRVFSNMIITGSWYNQSLSIKDEDEKYSITQGLRNYCFKNDFSWYTLGNNRFNAGLSIRYVVMPPVRETGNSLELNSNRTNNKANSEIFSGFYLEGDVNIAKPLTVSGGVKFTFADKRFNSDAKMKLYPEPTFSMRYKLPLGISLKAAASRNYQFYHGASIMELLIPFDRYLLTGEKLQPQYANHFSSGIFYENNQKSIEFSIEAYSSKLYNQYRIPVSYEVYINREEDINPVNGIIKSKGIEFSARKISGKLKGMINYTLSEVQRKEEIICQGRYYNPFYDRRHDLVININYLIAPKITLSANWVYMSGNPYSLPVGKYELRGRSIPVYDNDNLYNRHMPDYHRLDMSAKFNFGKRKPPRHSFTFMVYNVYARKNPVFYAYSDVADGNLELDANSGYKERLFSMWGYYFFNIFPAISYEFKLDL